MDFNGRRMGGDIPDQVAARRFVLVDEDANPRAALMATRDGVVGIHIMSNPDLPPADSVCVNDQDDTPMVIVRRAAADGSSEGAVALVITEDGKANIHLEDADGATRNFTT